MELSHSSAQAYGSYRKRTQSNTKKTCVSRLPWLSDSTLVTLQPCLKTLSSREVQALWRSVQQPMVPWIHPCWRRMSPLGFSVHRCGFFLQRSGWQQRCVSHVESCRYVFKLTMAMVISRAFPVSILIIIYVQFRADFCFFSSMLVHYPFNSCIPVNFLCQALVRSCSVGNLDLASLEQVPHAISLFKKCPCWYRNTWRIKTPWKKDTW